MKSINFKVLEILYSKIVFTCIIVYCLLNDKKIRSKGLVQGPGVQKTFRLSSHTPEQFNIMPRIT